MHTNADNGFTIDLISQIRNQYFIGISRVNRKLRLSAFENE